MTIHAVKEYYAKVEKMIHFGGTKKETAIRNAFYTLLNQYADQRGLILVPEITIKTTKGKNITPDGTIKDALRQDWGYWESKDEADDIDEEIAKKFAKGYPRDNILFEDSRTAVLYQGGEAAMRVSMQDAEALDRIIRAFVNYERPEVTNFRTAIALFRDDIPKVTDALRDLITMAEANNPDYVKRRDEFFRLCQEVINPAIAKEDIREMMIQHILTADIFNTIFDEPYFHRENNVAQELEKVLATFFTGAVRQTALAAVKPYYDTINAAAAGIADHHEKQKFLKVVYETFYKSYNPKAADRLGVVYTPNELVRFMIESADYLLFRHFGKLLEDPGVEILDPVVGTGTFVCDLIDHIRREKLPHKYKNEIHANEVAILPYYIANLNIEFTYKQKMNKYEAYENLCFVDTLDNMGFDYRQKQGDIFGLSVENTDRIRRQNERKISVIIGNPPYNANQLNENENNKNREYPEIDKRIRHSFIKYSTAQKTKVYDMYARFYRWAFDRLDSNGVIAFVTNRSFIDSRTFDGFRKCIQDEFDYAYIVDTKSDVRKNPKIAGTTHNIFGIQTGVAVMFLVKKHEQENAQCLIRYAALDDFWRKEQKLQWLAQNPLKNISFEHIQPDKNNNWINLAADSDWRELLPVTGMEEKISSINSEERKIFGFHSLGVSTNRDEWVFDFNEKALIDKICFFIEHFNSQIDSLASINRNEIDNQLDYVIKWSSAVKNNLFRREKLLFNKDLFRNYFYRPFVTNLYYAEKKLSDRLTANHYELFGADLNNPNLVIAFSGPSSSRPFSILATNRLFSLDFIEKTQCLPLYRYDAEGSRHDNITAWGLQQFQDRYQDPNITREDIFHYVYAVLHCPAYREKYDLNLKREFPRIPYYDNFHKWRDWGKELMELHTGFETAPPFELKIFTNPEIKNPRARLKADKEKGQILLDDATTLTGVPVLAWDYRLGNRAALEWVMEQYKDKKSKDPTIAEKFHTYRFSDYKEKVIDLLKRVCTVSIATMGIVKQMDKAANSFYPKPAEG